MRKIDTAQIALQIKEAFRDIEFSLPKKALKDLTLAYEEEPSPEARGILEIILKNQNLAKRDRIPLCQDTGLPQVKLILGHEIELTGEPIKTQIENGIREVYQNSLLRKSACHPITRKNLNTMIPLSLELEIEPGDQIQVFLLAKGGGCDNKGKLFNLPPTSSKESIQDSIVEGIFAAGPDACPPFYVGVSIGGSFVNAASHARDALFNTLVSLPIEPEEKELAHTLKTQINKSGLGPMGVGGKTTVLDLGVKISPTHIASLPIAINICCHSFRAGYFVI
jgi:fumarate hydratase subunit alpha